MNKDTKMSFWEHLDEFRSRLIVILISIFLGSLIGYYYSEKVIQFIMIPSKNLDISFQVITVISMFMIKLTVCFFIGFLIGFPILIYNVIQFLLPAFQVTLKGVSILVIFSSLFFFAGASFAYYFIIPFLLNFFTSISFNSIEVKYNFTLGSYLSYAIWTMFINGMIFQMPIISVVGARLGILTPEFLRHYRRHSFIFFLILSALITPPDPLSQILICIPFAILYELSIMASKLFSRQYND